MIVLDTNMVSEPLKPKPAPAVLHWLDAQEPQTLYITSIVWAELLAGVAASLPGRRRNALAQAMTEQVLAWFDSRVLLFDTGAAEAFAKNHASEQSHGNPMAFQIAPSHRLQARMGMRWRREIRGLQGR